MTKDEFERWLGTFSKNVFKPWKIQTNSESFDELTMGCFFSTTDKKWKVYENGEGNSHYIAYETEKEEEAFNLLRSKAELLLEHRKWFY